MFDEVQDDPVGVETNLEPLQTQSDEEEQAYISSTVEVIFQIPELLKAVIEKFCESPEAMEVVAASEGAWAYFMKNEFALATLLRAVTRNPVLLARILVVRARVEANASTPQSESLSRVVPL